eukprot:8305505-Karenia_brevis.AAC.1
MEAKRTFWMEKWDPEHRDCPKPEQPGWMRQLREEAKEEAKDKEEYQWHQIQAAAKQFSYTAGTGADQARPRH